MEAFVVLTLELLHEHTHTNTQQQSHKTHTNTISNRSYNKYSHVCELQFCGDCFFFGTSENEFPVRLYSAILVFSRKELNRDVCCHTQYKVKHIHRKCHRKSETTQFCFECFRFWWKHWTMRNSTSKKQLWKINRTFISNKSIYHAISSCVFHFFCNFSEGFIWESICTLSNFHTKFPCFLHKNSKKSHSVWALLILKIYPKKIFPNSFLHCVSLG